MAQRRRPPTRSGLLPEARHVVLPKGIKTSGFPAVEATCKQLGLLFDPWQRDLNRCILGKGKDGLYAADLIGISIPRQVGKTWDIGALVFALSIIRPGITVVWTAHRFKVARETFNSLRGVAMTPALAPHIDPDDIYSAAGNESITFRNGSRIVFAARERGAVRGFSEVEALILDEGQILTEAALSDLVPTTNQAKNPLIIIMGTPPKPADPGEVFTRLRQDALAGESEDVLWVEFGAPQGADPADRAMWRVANPSHPKRTTVKAILRMKKALSPPDFLREGLGIWDDDADRTAVNFDAWKRNLDANAEFAGPVSLGVAVSNDKAWSVIGTVGPANNGRRLALVKTLKGMDATAAEVARLCEKHSLTEVRLRPNSRAVALIEDLEELGVTVRKVKSAENQQAVGTFIKDVSENRYTHVGQPELDDAVRVAQVRDVNGAEVWDSRSRDVSPLDAITLAASGLADDYDIWDSILTAADIEGFTQ